MNLQRLLHRTEIRYLISGSAIFAINMGVASLFFHFESFNSNPLSRNVANILALHIALLISYPVHKVFTWREGPDNFFKKLVKFYIISISSVVFRTLFFAVFDFFGLNWSVSTVLSILLILIYNFIGFDRFVFNRLASGPGENDPYAAEGKGVKTLDTIEEAASYNGWIADKIKTYLGKENLELGAGRGTISAIILKSHRVFLNEIAEDNLSVLKNRFEGSGNLLGITEDLSSLQGARSFDAVYSSNVLEHIEDDLAVIGESIRLLNPGSFFVAFVPAMPFLYSHMDASLGHFRRYGYRDKKRIENYLKESGVSAGIVKFRFFNPVGALGWFVKMKIFKQDRIKKSDAMTMNSLIKILSLLDFVPWPFGQNIFMVIKKTNPNEGL